MLKTRRLQGEPVQRRIAIIRSRLAGTGPTPGVLRLAGGLAGPGKSALHIPPLRHLLSIVPQLNDSIDDPHLAGRFVALYSLMQGKELAGQERALGAIGFTQGFFDDVTRQRLVDRIDGQQACFEIADRQCCR